jgi:transcriptional regulator with XRE-family HTH domain
MAVRRIGVAPTPRSLFGTQLRRLRERAGLTQEQLADRIQYSDSTVAAIEAGRRAPAEGAPERLDAALNAGDHLARLAEDLGEGLRANAVLHPEWFREWPEREHEAIRIRGYEPIFVPGLLQTEAYARALLSGRKGSQQMDAEEMVAARLERQTILDRDDPAELWVVMDEAVLVREVGGPEVMRQQCERLAEMARRSHVMIQLIPRSITVHEGLNAGGFAIADLQHGRQVAYQETALHGQALYDAEHVATLLDTWDRLKALAQSVPDSLALVEEAGRTWTSAACSGAKPATAEPTAGTA